MIDLDKIYFEDCLEGMKRIPDMSIDAIICDLPYGYTACKWDMIIPFDPLWKQYLRVAKENAAIVLFCNEPFTSALITSQPKLFRQELTWLKNRPTNVMNAKKQFMNWTEDIAIFYRSLPTFNPQFWDDGTQVKTKVQHLHTDRNKGHMGKTGEREGFISVWGGNHRYPKSVLEFSNVNHGKDCLHPTQKPVDLIAYLIRTYSNEGDTILDNCMGSGTTAIAALRENRHFIGFENNAEYFEKASKRIELESQQLRLF